MQRVRVNTKELENKIYQHLSLNEAEEEPGVLRQKKDLGSSGLQKQLEDLKGKSDRKKKRMSELISSGPGKDKNDISEEMKELQWRLEVLRNDRREWQQKKSTGEMTFEELYNRQKNKYSKFRERQKIKVSDPKYLDMIGSMQMRREKRKLEGLSKIDKHIEMLDLNIKNHSLEGHEKRRKR